MEDRTKKLIWLFLILAVGSAFVLSGLSLKLHHGAASGISSFLGVVDAEKESKMHESLGYFVEIVIITVLFFTPFCGLAAPWMARISYDLIFGYNSGTNVFILSEKLNLIMGALFLFVSLYSVYLQHLKLNKMARQKHEVKDTLARFL